MVFISSQVQHFLAYIHSLLNLSVSAICQQLIKSQLPVKRISVVPDLFLIILIYFFFKEHNLQGRKPENIKCHKNANENPIVNFMVKTRS